MNPHPLCPYCGPNVHQHVTHVTASRQCLTCAAIRAAEDAARREEREQCCRAVRTACEWCGGFGTAIELPGDVVVECPACGHPIAALRARSQAAPECPATEGRCPQCGSSTKAIMEGGPCLHAWHWWPMGSDGDGGAR